MNIPVANLQKKIQTVKEYMYRVIAPIGPIRCYEGEITGAEAPSFDDSGWQTFKIGEEWGGRDTITWFRMPLEIPRDIAQGKLALIIQPGKRFVFISSEGGDLREYELMLYLDGQPLQSIDVRRNTVPLWDKVKAGEKHFLAIEAFSGLEEHRHRFEQADIVLINEETEDFYYNLKNAYEAFLLLDENDSEYHRLFNILQETLLKVDFLQMGGKAFFASIQNANTFLKEQLYSKLPDKSRQPQVVSVGHSHLDIAWQWQTKHSRRKAGRTAANVLRIMELYDDFKFLQSQAQLYQYIKERYPALFAKIKEWVRSGQWEVTGGMWVEPDANIPSGESLVRQFLYGKRFFRREFNVDPKVLWLPDGFGFCYTLPQIIKKSAMDYFMTTKMSWSQFEKIPYDTFQWQGLDGTRVLTHMITTPDRRGWNDYSVDLTPEHIVGCWNNYKQKDKNDTVLLSYGWGDGGGGPTPDMMENSRRFDYLPSLPRHKQGTAEKFFSDLQTRAAEFPVWDNELYLQFHRGCYTSQAAIKKANRESEILYHNAELFCALAFLQGASYPQQALNRGWELILLNQFHDILPGSSIAEVYQDSAKEYEEVRTIADDALKGAFAALTNGAQEDDLNGETLTLFNALSWKRSDLALIPLGNDKDISVLDEQGNELPLQFLTGAKSALLYAGDVPSAGYRKYSIKKGSTGHFKSSLKVTVNSLENRFFKISLNKHAMLSSVYDKRYEREVLAAEGNQLQIFEDRPLRNNAWDIDIFFQDKMLVLRDFEEIKIVENGPLRGGLRIKRKFLDSEIVQTIYIYEHLERIDFDTRINWRQHETLLKAAFPLNIHSSKAAYEIPYGVIERTTHKNTVWDWAQFEVPAQKWADLSEGGYGVSLLNDSKYGYDIKENVMRLTLIKSAIDPDPNADIGEHHFVYSLMPHAGGSVHSEIFRRAYELNNPLIAQITKSGQEAAENRQFSFVKCSAENVIIETVKKEEDGVGIVIRLYETVNSRGPVELEFAYKLQKVYESNLLEEERREVKSFEGTQLSFHIKPYEIKTYVLYFNLPN